MTDKTQAQDEQMVEVAEVDTKNARVHELFELAEEIRGVRPSATTRAMFKLYLILSVGYFCIILQGYDSSLMGAINAMPQYLNYYGLCVFN